MLSALETGKLECVPGIYDSSYEGLDKALEVFGSGLPRA